MERQEIRSSRSPGPWEMFRCCWTQGRIDSAINTGRQAVNVIVDTARSARSLFQYMRRASNYFDRIGIPGLGGEFIPERLANGTAAQGEDEPSIAELERLLLESIDEMRTDFATLTNRGYATLREAMDDSLQTILELPDQFADIVDTATSPSRSAYYAIELGNDAVIRGQTQDDGSFDVVLPPMSRLPLSMYDPTTGFVLETTIRTGASGSSAGETRLILDSDPNDTDGDGVSDTGEFVVGSNKDLPDSNGDGVSDLAALQAGLDPLAGIPIRSGVFASISLRGDAYEVFVEGSTLDTTGQTAYVATGNAGMAIVDTSNPFAPVIVGEVDLPGTATDVVADSHVGLAAVAVGGTGIHLVDISDPQLPSLVRTVSSAGSINRIELFGRTLFTGGSQFSAIDLVSGELLQQIDLGAPVTDLAREGGFFVATTLEDTLHVIDVSTSSAEARGSIERDQQ